MIVSCKRCHIDFQSTRTLRVYCSRECQDASSRTIDLVKLAEFASSGRPNRDMALAFGVSRPTITRALQTHGLYGTWQAIRYSAVALRKAKRKASCYAGQATNANRGKYRDHQRMLVDGSSIRMLSAPEIFEVCDRIELLRHGGRMQSPIRLIEK